MPRTAVTEWDTTAGNNSDVAGINIAEGCPAGGINDAIRTMMAQIASWVVSSSGPLTKAGGAMTGALTSLGNGSTILDSVAAQRGLGYRNIPLTQKTAAYQIVLSDVGQGISITGGGVTVPANAITAFAIGDTVVIYNNSGSAQAISPGGVTTLRLVGTATTGARTLAQRGVATLLKVATDEWVVSGGGVS